METNNHIVESSVDKNDISINWITRNGPEGPYEVFDLPFNSTFKSKKIIAFYRYKTDCQFRTQYDLGVEVIDFDGDPTLYWVGVNLFGKQCEPKIIQILNDYR